MNARTIAPNIYALGAIDWSRRLFDSLIPLPDGTSYNSYLIKGSDKTALLDTVDPSFTGTLLEQIRTVHPIDYIVHHHAEQDHSGALPELLIRYPEARVVTNQKCKEMLIDHLQVPGDRFVTVADGELLSLGDKTLECMLTPWVHWPETMTTYLREDKILFSCDFFGSHLATTDLYATDEARVYEAAKRYYAEIMMPFRTAVQKNIAKVTAREIACIAPSHGPVYRRPQLIIDAYRDWTSDKIKNEVVLPFISMHGSTKAMVDRLVAGLVNRGVSVLEFDLAVTDIGKLAISLVDAATIVIGAPTVHAGPHPTVLYAANLANALRPKAKFASVIGSYAWHTKAVEQIASAISNLKVEILSPVVCKGCPRQNDFDALDNLADAIAQKHADAGL
jgi:flavorubredoxin